MNKECGGKRTELYDAGSGTAFAKPLAILAILAIMQSFNGTASQHHLGREALTCNHIQKLQNTLDLKPLDVRSSHGRFKFRET
jgi:hypothetical protein